MSVHCLPVSYLYSLTGIFRHEQTAQVCKEDTKVMLSTDMFADRIFTDLFFTDNVMGLKVL